MAKKKSQAPTKKSSKKLKKIQFLKADALYSNEMLNEGIFPPTVYSDAVYSKGIRLFPESCEVENDSVSLSYDYDYVAPTITAATRRKLGIQRSLPYTYNGDTVPVLSEQDAQIWSHKRASRSAVQQHFPMQVYRLLGTITRRVTVTNDLPEGPFTNLSKYSPTVMNMASQNSAKPSRMAMNAAKKEAMAENFCTTQVEARAKEIQTHWNNKIEEGPRRKGWDHNGQLPRDAVNDDQYIPLTLVRDWLKRQAVVDPSPSHTSLYNGIRSIPNDIKSIVTSLLEMSSPQGLFNVPLILPFCAMEVVEESRTSATAKPSKRRTDRPVSKKRKTESVNRTWRIRIGVYANRLLPEVMTSHDLHIIMTALDPGSFRVTEPLHLPPSPPEAVFESAPTPVVVTDESYKTANTAAFDSDEEEKKSDDIVDLTIGDSTRDDSRISAFSVKGFLKLLESTGNDISNWPMIESKIAPIMNLKLMLHQQHAICWMQQMESLSGLGINSMLWEEREFLDGGKYYYSPALGQMRLVEPPVMKGGVLADEQGLGKTFEVLGLIIASLEELKQEAEEALKDTTEDDLIPTHATLIIVPPALVSQWKAEICKAVGDALEVQYYNPKTLIFEQDSEEEADPDIVITTYAALEAPKSSQILSSFVWGRIVLDEMQEIRSSTTKIAKNCDSLVCQRRWMLSGTPLFDGIDDLRGELNFLRLDPYSANLEDGFFDFSITNHWAQHSIHGLETLRILGMLILRRSKSMTIVSSQQPLLGLKPLTIEFVPIPQDPSERAVYCFLESIVSRELNERSGSSKARCLRMLREVCISSVLLSGGMGTNSQLKTLQGWMVNENRRQMRAITSLNGTASAQDKQPYPFPCHRSTFSVETAIQHLSSAQEDASVGKGFVTDQRQGFGGGGSSRNRAAEDFETQLKDTTEAVESAEKALNEAKSKKAKARWHYALEKVTTGAYLGDDTSKLNPSFVLLWSFRFAVISLTSRDLYYAEDMPAVLLRGWRLSLAFVEHELFKKRPNFAWAHPFSYQVEGIPSLVSTSEVKDSIVVALERSDDDGAGLSSTHDDRVNVVNTHSNGEIWQGVVQFASEADYNSFEKQTRSKHGIVLLCKSLPPQLQAAIDSARVSLDEASAQYKVYPSTSAKRQLDNAEKEHGIVMEGLRIVSRDSELPYHLRARKPLGPCRSSTDLLSFSDFDEKTKNTVVQSNQTIRQKSVELADGNKRLSKLRNKLSRQVPDDVQSLTVFETLCALSKSEKEKTKCPICLCNLGIHVDESGNESSALVAMTHCSHVFCAECLKLYEEKRGNICCPSCRRNIDASSPVILIDTEKTEDRDRLEEKRQEAKSFVLKVAKRLDESNGQLDAETWEALYHSIDLPPQANDSREARFNAIPGEFLGHLREATQLHMDARPNDTPNTARFGNRAGLASKIRALLADLPRDERSVVFTESKAAVTHLMAVLAKGCIGCRALFSGEAVAAAEVALNDWKSYTSDDSGNKFIPFPVLIVQAGAAASGLTLTAACKMFMLEPFQRMEEEQQAYARCHRYGQEHPVHVKVYYAPVSVESRLLEWRKRASELPTGNITDTCVVYAAVATTEDHPEEDDMEVDERDVAAASDNEVEQSRTAFLLRLTARDEQVASSTT